MFGNLLGDTIVRIENMGRPNPILESPFAKLLKAEEAFHSNPSTPVKLPNNVVSSFASNFFFAFDYCELHLMSPLAVPIIAYSFFLFLFLLC